MSKKLRIEVTPADSVARALEQSRLTWDAVPEIGEVITGRSMGRTASTQITLYESLGMGIQDLYIGAKVLELARAAGKGVSLPIDAPPDSKRVIHV